MEQYIFDENVSKEEFEELAAKPNVKSHFLGSYTWGNVAKEQGRIPFYVGVRKVPAVDPATESDASVDAASEAAEDASTNASASEATDPAAEGDASKKGELVATALLLKKHLFKGYSYFYIPRGFTMDYSDRELLKFMTESIDKFCRKHKSLYFKIDPDIKLHTIDTDGKVIKGEENTDLVIDLKKMGYKHQPLNYFFEAEQPRFTFRLSLDGDMEEIENGYGKTTKNILKQTDKNQIEVTVGTSQDIAHFNRLMHMTEKRQDFFGHKQEYYQFFYDTLKEDGMVALYLGHLDIPKLMAKLDAEMQPLLEEKEKLEASGTRKAKGKLKEVNNRLAAFEKQKEQLSGRPQEKVVISAYLMVYYDDKAWTLYAGNDMDYSKFYGNYAVYRQAIIDAKNDGYKIFDGFGSTGRPGADPHLDGLYEFKKKWGGEFTEFIGEFDFVQNKPLYFMYKKLIPIYHKRVNKKMRKQIQEENK